jgi:hypothetical protein
MSGRSRTPFESAPPSKLQHVTLLWQGLLFEDRAADLSATRGSAHTFRSCRRGLLG